MDLQTHQYQMWLAAKKHQDLIGQRQKDPDNLALQKEILDVLCQLVAINESQKLVVAKLREERENEDYRKTQRRESQKEDIDLLCDEQMLHDNHDKAGSEPPHVTHKGKSPVREAETHATATPCSDYAKDLQDVNSDDCFEEPATEVTPANQSEPNSPTGWCSPEKRLHNFQPPTADYSMEDIHDLVTEDEFMHALGLLTVRECREVMDKRYERRKRNAYSHIFSNTIWEKPETRRKRRAWLMSGAGSPPTLRRKVRPPSQPPSQPQSRPCSPAQSSCSPPTTCPPSQAASPQSVEEEFPVASQPSEEVCPMCKMKGADVQCDGCGVIYHGPCVDLGDAEPPPCWLCLTCEQLGLRASTNSDPQYHSRRREALEIRERLLRQRAELTISKLQLEERKRHLALALQAQCSEREKLQHKEEEVREAIHQLQNFIYTFQQPEPPHVATSSQASSPAATSPVATSHQSLRTGVTASPPPNAGQKTDHVTNVRSPSPSSYPLDCCQAASSSPNSPTNTLKWSETSSTPSPSPSDITPQLFLPGLTITRTSSPGQSSQASSLNHSSSKSIVPSLTISRTSPPSPKSNFLSSVTISQSQRSQVNPQPYVSVHTTYASSPTQPSSNTSSPGHQSSASFYPGIIVSPSCSPKPSISISPIYNTGGRSRTKHIPHTQRALATVHGKKQRSEARLRAALTHQNEADIHSQPTDLSSPSHSRKNGIPGIRRGENDAMAASL